MTEQGEPARIAELEADNRRLRRLLEQQDAPGELRHRLHGTLAMLRVIIRRSAETERELPDYVAHLEDRLDALARAQTAADERGAIQLHDLLADELLHYGAEEGEQASLSGPAVHLRPRAGQVLALAAHELAVNAIEHGALGGGVGKVVVSWTLEPTSSNPVLEIRWKEIGPATAILRRRDGFGTEMLTRTVAYELSATASFDYEADGLAYTLRFPLIERLGGRS